MPTWILTRTCALHRRLSAEEGNILVLSAFGFTLLCGLMALAIDTGLLVYTQRQMQTMADAAAVAGVIETSACGGTANCTAMQNAAKAAVLENGADSVTLVSQCGSGSASGLLLMVNNGPCALGANDPNNGNDAYVETVVSMPVKTIFGSILGKNSFTVSARSEAGNGPPKYCLYILSPNGSNALLVNGNSSLTASCGVMDDSNAHPAATFNGHDTISTTALDIVGSVLNNGNNSITPTPQTGVTSSPDPLSGLPTPTIGACGTSTSSPYTGATNQVVVNGGPGVTATFNPGVYCNGITLNGNASATFNPGTYIVKGSMIVNGGDSISGSGVTFYFTNSGSLTMNGNSHAVLSAPTSGTYEGILYFQDRNDSSTVILNGDTTSKWEGTFYAAAANLTLNGGSNLAAYTNMVVKTLTQNGNVNFTIGSDYSSLADGSPIKQHRKAAMVE